jgi:hypothetical protein
VVIRIAEFCESCGKMIEPCGPAKTLEDSFALEKRKTLGICTECFKKRFKIVSRRSSGYGGTIYELRERSAPRFGLGSKKLSCLRCDWIAWTDQGLAAHVRKRHPA